MEQMPVQQYLPWILTSYQISGTQPGGVPRGGTGGAASYHISMDKFNASLGVTPNTDRINPVRVPQSKRLKNNVPKDPSLHLN